ncbi:MAG: anti-sigma factor [Phototrophicaceae bacterium]|jgi:anti-sigma-K factor RskA
MERQTLLDLIPAYALGALDADERALLEAFLPTDPEAQTRLREYQQVAAALTLGVPILTPPAALEGKLRQRLVRRQQQRVILFAAGFAAAVLVVGLFSWMLAARTLPPEQLYARLAQDRAAAHWDVTAIYAGADALEGDLITNPDGTQAVIRVSNLPAIGADQAFQLWLIDDNGSINGGLYRLEQPVNYIRVPLQKPVSEYVRFGVSLEPATGSPLGNRSSGTGVFRVTLR